MVIRVAELGIHTEGVDAVSGAVELERLKDETVEGGREIRAAAVVVRGERVVVLRERIVTARHLIGVAHAVAVDIRGAVSTTDTGRIELVSVTVAVAGRDVSTAAFVDGAGTVADSACLLYTSPSPRDS